MADLLARFKLVDEMSDKLESMAESGQRMTDQWERAGEATNAAFEGVAGAVTTATSTVDGVATSIDSITGAADSAASSADSLAESLNEYEGAVSDAAAQTDYWTDAVGNYDRSALEAIYTTEELVNMGLKSAEALEAQERAIETCEQAASGLSQAIEEAATTQNKLSTAVEKADTAISELADNENVSAETKAELARAAERAQEAIDALSRANEEADAAMEAYNQTMTSGTDDMAQLEAAAERAASATEALAQANNTASEATEELSRATEQATEEAENSGKSGIGAIEGVAGALAAAGITAKVTEIATAVYDLAESFTEAEKIIVASTGATGQELDKLMESSLNVFASSSAESLNDVAAGMTAVKTSTGLAGEELEAATGYALSLENALGFEVAESSRTASALMKNFGLTAKEAYNLITIGAQEGANKNGDLMDILNEYSAQYAALGLSADEFMSSLIDGAEAGVFSVDKVGDAVKEFNIRAKDGSETSAEAFELLGMDAEAMTAKFAAGGDTARTAFFEVVNALDSMSDPIEKNTAAVGLFGTMYEDLEAGILPVLANIEGGTLEMHDAIGTVASDAQSLSDKWQQAGNSIQAAFTSAVEPAITGISGGLADVVSGFGTFLNEHPAVTKAITAIGVGLGVAVVAIAAVATASLTAIPAVAALGTAISAAIWPITAIAAGVAAVVGVVLLLADAFSAAEDETAGMTATTRAQYYELQDLNAEYEEACEKYGETSEEALRLKYQVDDLSAAFEANRQTVEEFTAEVDALIQSHDELISGYEESMTAINNNEVGTLALIQKLEDLATTNDKTAASEEQMKSIIDQLNNDLPDLALSYDDVTNSTEACVEAMKKAAEAQAEQERQAEQKQAYVDLLKEQATLEEEIAKAEENVRLEQERMDDMSGWTHFWTAGEWDDLEAYEAALEELNAAYAENKATLAGIEQDWEEVATATQEAEEQTVTYEDAVSTALSSVQSEMDELCAAYDEAYEAARSSIDSTIGLFDTMSTECESSVSDMLAALESQTAYLDTYTENLQKAAQYGLDEGLIQSLSDGSEESAGYLQEIISNIEALGGSTEGLSADAQEFVDSFNGAFAEVQTSKDEFAAAVADMETNFTEGVDAIGEKMQEMISDMNMSDDAAAQASATMDSYISSIKAKQAEAVSAANAVAAATAAALSSTASSSASVSVPGHANGTTNAESAFIAGEEGRELIVSKAAAYANGTTDSDPYYIAGENGPELIIGQQGSTVFPTEETDRIIDALGNKQPLQVFSENHGGGDNEKATEQVKRILLEIAGSGAIEVAGGSGGADKETILEVLYEHLKPVLMNIIQSEIYEEGELSYEF